MAHRIKSTEPLTLRRNQRRDKTVGDVRKKLEQVGSVPKRRFCGTIVQMTHSSDYVFRVWPYDRPAPYLDGVPVWRSEAGLPLADLRKEAQNVASRKEWYVEGLPFDE